MSIDISKIERIVSGFIKSAVEVIVSYSLITYNIWTKPRGTLKFIRGSGLNTYLGITLTPVLYFFINVFMIYILSFNFNLKIQDGVLLLLNQNVTSFQSLTDIVVHTANYSSGFICFATIFFLIAYMSKCSRSVQDIVESMAYASAVFIPLHIIDKVIGLIFNYWDFFIGSINKILIPMSNGFFYPDISYIKLGFFCLGAVVIVVVKYIAWGFVFLSGLIQGDNSNLKKIIVVTSWSIVVFFIVSLPVKFDQVGNLLKMYNQVKISELLEAEEEKADPNFGRLYFLTNQIASSENATPALTYRGNIRAVTYLIGSYSDVDLERAGINDAIIEYREAAKGETTLEQSEVLYDNMLQRQKEILNNSFAKLKKMPRNDFREYYYLLKKIESHIDKADKAKGNPEYDSFKVALEISTSEDDKKETLNVKETKSKQKSFVFELIP